MPAQKTPDGLAPRVAVLETAVERVQADVGSLRQEARDGFGGLRNAVDGLVARLIAQEAAKPRQTNWYAVAGFVVAAVTITGAIFSLAEWRVSTAFDPLKEAVREQRRELNDAREALTKLRIESEVQKVIRGAQSKLSGDAR